MTKIYLLLFAFPIILFGQMSNNTKSDYWIIENPSALVIYNQYEQRLTQQERTILPGNSAWRILEQDHVLSDQFTHTIKTSLYKQIFYIQISDNSELVNKSLAGNIREITSALIQGDTVRITTSDQLTLQTGEQRSDLSEGLLLERIFLYRNKTFVRKIAGNAAGWIEGNGPANWEIYIPDNSDLALQKQLFEKVDHTVQLYNTRMDKLFTLLNNEYDTSNPTPHWIAEKSPSYLKYKLSPSEYLNRFEESQKFLFQEISDLLYGSTYQLSASDGQFIIIRSTE